VAPTLVESSEHLHHVVVGEPGLSELLSKHKGTGEVAGRGTPAAVDGGRVTARGDLQGTGWVKVTVRIDRWTYLSGWTG
jgi:hypothetical protein